MVRKYIQSLSSILRYAGRFITDFKGYSGRLEYGLTYLFVLIVLPLFILLAGGADDLIEEWIQYTHEAFSGIGWLGGIVLVVAIVSMTPMISFIVVVFLFPLLGVEMGVLLNPNVEHWMRLPLVLLFAVMGVPFMVSYLAVTARRLHDTNRTRWVTLVSLVPVFNLFLLFLFYEKSFTKKPSLDSEKKPMEVS